jgi:XapX domain-containing protein
MRNASVNWRQAFKIGAGIVLGFCIGFACRMFDMPSPAPTAMAGALLVFAMTCGWKITDYWFIHRPKKSVPQAAGPTAKPTHREL